MTHRYLAAQAGVRQAPAVEPREIERLEPSAGVRGAPEPAESQAQPAEQHGALTAASTGIRRTTHVSAVRAGPPCPVSGLVWLAIPSESRFESREQNLTSADRHEESYHRRIGR